MHTFLRVEPGALQQGEEEIYLLLLPSAQQGEGEKQLLLLPSGPLHPGQQTDHRRRRRL